eukprot:9191955-Lingulodinium_polyedra.AAC.1
MAPGLVPAERSVGAAPVRAPPVRAASVRTLPAKRAKLRLCSFAPLNDGLRFGRRIFFRSLRRSAWMGAGAPLRPFATRPSQGPGGPRAVRDGRRLRRELSLARAPLRAGATQQQKGTKNITHGD